MVPSNNNEDDSKTTQTDRGRQNLIHDETAIIMEEETFSSSSRICPSSQNEYIAALLSRLENSEKECNRLRQALKHSEGINSQLKAENDQLLNKVTNNPRNTPFSTTEGNNDSNNNMKQQNEQHKAEIEQIRSELLLLAEGSGSSIDVIAKLKMQVTNLQENKEILIDMKDSLSTLIDDLIGSNTTRTSSSSSSPHDGETVLLTKEGLEDIRDKLDMIDLGKKKQEEEEVEQCDLIAEKVAEAKKKKKNGGGLLGHRLLPMIEPLFAATNEDYGYKIEKPPDEEFNTGNTNKKDDTNPRMHDSEILGEDIYIPDLPSETHATECNGNPPWWDVVSLEFDNDVKDEEDDHDNGGSDENNNNTTSEAKSFFGNIFGG